MDQLSEGPAASAGRLHTRICDLFGVRYPIVQTGMGYVSGPELTAATAQAGGLGIIAGGAMGFDELQAAIRRTKELTDRPFGVNLRASQPDVQRRMPGWWSSLPSVPDGMRRRSPPGAWTR